MSQYNLFIEGTQGSGKSTLTNILARKYPQYQPYREGDLSPVELAWCAYMTEAQYQETLEKYAEFADEIVKNTHAEGNMRVVAYTRILADMRAFYEYMEGFEIYNARVPYEQFKEIILFRYRQLNTTGNIFECSLFQNIIETMMLFYEMSDEEIIDFYHDIYDILKKKHFKLIYLKTANLKETIEQAKRERVDDMGEEIWFQLVMRYFETSPYGRAHNCSGIEDYVLHLMRRMRIEECIMQRFMGEDVLLLPAKSFDVDLIQL